MGLMREEWTRADLQLAQRELSFFTPRQAEVLRNRISASRFRIAGKSIQKYSLRWTREVKSAVLTGAIRSVLYFSDRTARIDDGLKLT